MVGDSVQQDSRLIDPRSEGRSGVGIAIRDEIAGEDLEVLSATLNRRSQNHKVAVRTKLVGGTVHPPIS
jgi:hypothetical protein